MSRSLFKRESIKIYILLLWEYILGSFLLTVSTVNAYITSWAYADVITYSIIASSSVQTWVRRTLIQIFK